MFISNEHLYYSVPNDEILLLIPGPYLLKRFPDKCELVIYCGENTFTFLAENEIVYIGEL